MDIVTSVNGVPIRLTDERWGHILRSHPELEPLRARLFEVLAEPDVVVRAGEGALRAVRTLTGGRHLVVLYREVSHEDGFVITAWVTRRVERVVRGEILWSRPS